ncbi:MAG: hypothetical protein ABJI96_11895 [Paracoccaceae bacterium]
MVQGTWFVDALKDLSEFAREEGLEDVLVGLSHVLETYAAEVGLNEHQQDEAFESLAHAMRVRS